jgi:hypothetical protein
LINKYLLIKKIAIRSPWTDGVDLKEPKNCVMKKITILLVSFCLVLTGMAQRTCGSVDDLKEQIRRNPQVAQNQEAIERFTEEFARRKQAAGAGRVEAAAPPVTYNVPVVVHVLWSSNENNISDAQVLSQIAVLNRDFQFGNADTGSVPAAFKALRGNARIQFCMAQRDPTNAPTTGIVRRRTAKTFFTTAANDAKSTAADGDDTWDASQYLNIWVVNEIRSGGREILGYGQFPGGAAATDGVVIGYKYFGTTGTARAPFNRGRTGTHEVGHYFNLRHIWGDEPLCAADDLVGDTPLQGPQNYGCPTFPKFDTCTKGPNGIMFMNFMDYTDDACMYMFSIGQVTRMQATLTGGGAHNSLITSDRCVPACPIARNMTASAITQSSAIANWVADAGPYAWWIEYRVTGTPAWTLQDGTAFVPNTQFTGLVANTTYEYRIKSLCDTSESAWRQSSFKTLPAPACYNFGEPNETRPTATVMPLGFSTNAAIQTTTDQDYYKFVLVNPSHIRLTLSRLAKDYDLFLYDDLGQLAASLTLGTANEQIERNLAPGNYYARVASLLQDTSYSCYSLTLAVSALCQSPLDAANNDNVGAAPLITNNTAIQGQIESAADVDYFRVVTTGAGTVTLTRLPIKIDMRLLNNGGTQIGISQNLGVANESINIPGAGTYYVNLYSPVGSSDAKNCYTLTVSAPGVNHAIPTDETRMTTQTIPIFPNPAINMLQADLSSFKGRLFIRIVDPKGQPYLEQRVQPGKVNLGVYRLISGLYVLQVFNEQGAMLGQQKFVKE